MIRYAKPARGDDIDLPAPLVDNLIYSINRSLDNGCKRVSRQALEALWYAYQSDSRLLIVYEWGEINTVDGRKVEVSGQTAEIIRTIALNSPMPVSSQHIKNTVWKDVEDGPSPNAFLVAISKAKNALLDYGLTIVKVGDDHFTIAKEEIF